MTMHAIVYNDIDWTPINLTRPEKEVSNYSLRPNFSEILDMSNPMSNLVPTNGYSDKIIDHSEQLNSRTIENELEVLHLDQLMSFVSPGNVVEMTVTSMASNLIIALGWIILGKIWQILEKIITCLNLNCFITINKYTNLLNVNVSCVYIK